MILLTLMLVPLTAGAPSRTHMDTVLDETVPVGPGKIRTLDLPLGAPNARVVCQYSVLEGRSGVRVLLMARQDAERWWRGQSHTILAGTSYGHGGSFSYRAQSPGDYRIVLDNRMEDHDAASVLLRVHVIHGEGGGTSLYGPDPGRAQIAVWSSVGLFLICVGWSGLRIRDALERRRQKLHHFYYY